MYRVTLSALCAVAICVVGCQTAPQTPERRAALQDESQTTVRSMTARDSSLQNVLDSAHGYAVFPSVGEAGAIAGAAYGRGIAYERGRPVGYVELNQGSLGAQLGGQSFSEIIVFENEEAFSRLREGRFDVGAGASATALNAGVAAETQFRDGVIVFVQPQGGLMADVSVSGQQINFEAMGGRLAGERIEDRDNRTDRERSNGN